jgi:hypothetical protein
MFQLPVVPQTFLQQLQSILVTFLEAVAVPLAGWIVYKIQTAHTAQLQNAAKLDNVVAATNGTNKALQDHITAQTAVATALATQVANDKVAALKAQLAVPVAFKP